MHVIGQNVDLTYPYNYLGQGAADLGAALKDKEWMQSFKEAKFPVVLVGPGILQRPDRDTILQQARKHFSGQDCRAKAAAAAMSYLSLQSSPSDSTLIAVFLASLGKLTSALVRLHTILIKPKLRSEALAIVVSLLDAVCKGIHSTSPSPNSLAEFCNIWMAISIFAICIKRFELQ